MVYHFHIHTGLFLGSQFYLSLCLYHIVLISIALKCILVFGRAGFHILFVKSTLTCFEISHFYRNAGISLCIRHVILASENPVL